MTTVTKLQGVSMHKAAKWTWLSLGCTSAALAQQPPVPGHILVPALTATTMAPMIQARTLGEHMESANNNYAKYLEIYKTMKLNELGAGGGVNLQTAKTPVPITPRPAKYKTTGEKKPVRNAPEPRLWYISGMGERLTAELIYERQVYRLDSTLMQQRVGPWTLVAMDNQGLMLQLADSPKQAWLEAPHRGQDPKPLLDAMCAATEPAADNMPLPKSVATVFPNTGLANFALPFATPKP